MVEIDGRRYHMVDAPRENLPLTQPKGDVVLSREEVENTIPVLERRLRHPDTPKADKDVYKAKLGAYRTLLTQAEKS